MLKRIAAAACLALACLGAAQAQERGTENEAKAMVEQALQAVKTMGAEQAFQEFSTPGGKWHAKDLYLFCYKLDGTNTCHGANKALIGKNLIDLQTADGQPLIKNMSGIASSKGSGWIEYRWPHPQTKKLEDKKAWVAKIPGYDGFLGVGVYK
ncbi:MAG: cache domain-containing protein [Rhodocyclales bacterium]|nr:cache domain-containing protein [Rhodocyclales bacterium]